LAGDAGNLGAVLGNVVVAKGAPCRQGVGAKTRGSGSEFTIEIIELQIASDRRGGTRSVRESGRRKPWIEILGDGAKPPTICGVEERGIEATLGKIKSGDECVCPPPMRTTRCQMWPWSVGRL